MAAGLPVPDAAAVMAAAPVLLEALGVMSALHPTRCSLPHSTHSHTHAAPPVREAEAVSTAASVAAAVAAVPWPECSADAEAVAAPVAAPVSAEAPAPAPPVADEVELSEPQTLWSEVRMPSPRVWVQLPEVMAQSTQDSTWAHAEVCGGQCTDAMEERSRWV